MRPPTYRIETTHAPRGSPQHYLVRDVWFKGRKKKVRKYLGTDPEVKDRLAQLQRDHHPEMELESVDKKSQLATDHYKARHLAAQEVRRIEHTRFLFQQARDLMSADEVEAYRREFERRYIQGTTAIEGNTLTLEETTQVLEGGRIPPGKSLREVNEVQNFRQVIRVRQEHKGDVDLPFIKKLHFHVMANIDLDAPGEFRRIDGVAIAGSDIRVAPAPVIEEELQIALADYYQAIREGHHPFEEAVLFHYRFEIIHPFLDGNGRVGREIFNYMLAREDYPRLLFLGERREEYLGALRHGNHEEYDSMVQAFVDLHVNQRRDTLTRNVVNLLEKRKVEQRRLFDFLPDQNR